MAAVKRVLCFGDSNTWGFVPAATPPTPGRFERDKRWPQVMAAALGGSVEVIEEALSGRTTDLADPEIPQVGGANMDGTAYLPAALASHLPLDLVIIMLGTNDVKPRFGRTAGRIALGAKRLLDQVRTLDGGFGTTYPNPRALLICPPPLVRLSAFFEEMFAGGHAKTVALAPLYEGVARMTGAAFLNAGDHIETDGEDGVHEAMQRKLGLAVAEKVREIFA
jgi:lysophospholipase L1-like esterase